MKGRATLVSTVAIVLLHGLWAQADQPGPIALVPQPLKMVRRGGAFELTRGATILVDENSQEAAQIGKQLAERINRGTGLGLTVAPAESGAAVRHAILLTTKRADAAFGPEGYTLEAAPEGVVISAVAGPGLFYGAQTLLQLLPPAVFRSANSEPAATWIMPAMRIEDRPRFPWRMLLLDVARHFFSKEEVKNFIDLMAQHKFNTLQLHLTDHEGWRIEIKRYPRLAQVGGWRNGILWGLDPKLETAYGPDGRYGGFYTQSDLHELIAYAKARYVTILPEIEMPGHCGAALSVYPQYSCTSEPVRREKTGGGAGPYCIGNEGTFAFLEGVLTEVIDVFPSKYIHVGGDEVEKTNWKKCPKCQARMRQEGLKDENQLQSYFIRRIEKFLNARQRMLVGWDEILEGGVAPNAVVMSWRGIEGGIAAANAGHDVVMTPVSHCYFDYCQAKTGEPRAIGGFLPLETVYAFEPVPAALAADKVRHVLGGGGNLWSEFVPNYAHVQYMVYPRACAMAEALWTEPQQRSWDDFTRRLGTHLQRLKAQAVNYRQPGPTAGSLAHAAEFERLAITSGVKSMTLPCMSRLQDGRLFVVWSNGGDGILGAFSADYGRSWSAPKCLLKTSTGHDYDPSLVVSGPRILLSATVTAGSGIGRSTTQCVRSDDNGQSWSPLYEIPMHHRYSCGKTHRGLRLKSGTLLMGYSWDLLCEQGKTLQSEGQMHLRAGVMISTDNGLNWQNGGDTDAACTPLSGNAVRGTDEPAIVERDDGSIYMLMRTGSDHLYQAHSTDEGKTWTAVGPGPLLGSNAPAALGNFQAAGRRGILCVWDNGLTRFPLCAAASFDGGKTWSKPKDIAGPTDGRQASYPSCEQAADGTLVAVWQQETSGGWDVRCARFRLDWLLDD